MSDWREQYYRMKRWRDAVAADRGDGERVTDIFFAFTQSCYHLVDWLANDPSRPISKSEATRYVFNSEALSFCADICNGAKHARLEEKDVDLSVEAALVKDYRFYPNEDRKDTRERVVQVLSLEWQGRSVLALRFADRCIEEWDVLLKGKGLI
jgi:hypothetical protein